MILFAGIPSEPPLALAIACAEQRGIPCAVVNQRHVGFCDLSLELDDAGVRGFLWFAERLWPLAEFTGVYSRLVDPGTLPENRPHGRVLHDLHEVSRSAFLHELFHDWLEISPVRVVNRPGAMASNGSKPYQAQLIVKCGFRTPPTLVTNDPAKVHEFHAKHGRIVYKSISSVRSIVQEWRPDRRDDLDKVRHLPTQFQAFIPGTNVRVHVIGEDVLASAVVSDATDYRYAGRYGLAVDMQAITLPTEIEERCRALTRSLGLSFSGIDLKRTGEDEWYCFEVNPSPGYSYFQEQTGQPISDTLVSYLSGMGQGAG
jgi:hypothetical protein